MRRYPIMLALLAPAVVGGCALGERHRLDRREVIQQRDQELDQLPRKRQEAVVDMSGWGLIYPTHPFADR
jgi:hypothetical protein